MLRFWRGLSAAFLLSAALFAGAPLAQAQTPGQSSNCPLNTIPKIVGATTYTLSSSDKCQWVILTNPGGITVTLPAPGLIFSPEFSTTFLPTAGGAITFVGQRDQAGALHLINSSTSLALAAGSGAQIKALQDMNWWVATLGGNGSGIVPPVVNHAALKALSAGIFPVVFREGYTTAGDGGGGTYIWNGASTCTDDGGSCVQPTTGSGRWLLVVPAAGVDVRAWGADATGASDATTAIQNCLNNAAVTCLAGAKYKILGNLTIPAHTALQCGLAFLDQEDTSLSLLGSMPALMLDSAHTISAGGQGATVEGCLIYRNGMTFPAADASAFAGQALFDNANGSFTVRNSVILGFDSCIRITGTRPIIDRVNCDAQGATHAAIAIENANTDAGHITRVKIQPIATGNYGQFSSTCSVVTRTGTGLKLGGIDFVDQIVSQNFQTYDYEIDAGLGGIIWSDFPHQCNVTYANSVGVFFNNSTTQFSTINVNSSGVGVKFLNGGFNFIGIIFLNSIGGDCIALGANATTGGIVRIGAITTNPANSTNTTRNCGNNAGAAGGTGRAVNYLDTTITSYIDIRSGYLQNIATTPYINIPSTVNAAFVSISDGITSDLADASSLFGAASVSCTGLGSGSCALATNVRSNPWAGQIIFTPSGSPAASGTVDVTFPYGTPDTGNCQVTYQDGASSWAATRVTPVMNGVSATVQRIRYDNGATLPTGAAALRINFKCNPQ